MTPEERARGNKRSRRVSGPWSLESTSGSRRRAKSRRRDSARKDSPERRDTPQLCSTVQRRADWRRGDKWVCEVASCRRQDRCYTKFDGLVRHFKANHVSRIELYECPLMRKEECLYSHERAEMVVRHALRSHREQYDDREMKRACTTLHMVIRRNSKYVSPGFLELPRDPVTGKKTDLSVGPLPANQEGYVPKRRRRYSQPPGSNPKAIREFQNPLQRSATTTQRGVGAASRRVGEPIEGHQEEACEKPPEVAQPTRLVSLADFQLPKPHRDFEEEKRAITTKIEEVLRQMDALKTEERQLREEYRKVKEAESQAKVASLEAELAKTTAMNELLWKMAQANNTGEK